MHALVTGASSGIGEAVAMALAGERYDLTLVARRNSELQRVAGAVGSRVKTSVCPYDLSDASGLETLVQRSEEALGPIDLLVNNAGVEGVARLTATRAEDIVRITQINYLSPCELIRLVSPGMVERRAGTIVNVASVAAYTSPPFLTFYSGSKAAFAAVSVSIRSELRRFGIHVVTVYPGPIRTPMGKRSVEVYQSDPTFGIPWGRVDVAARRIVSAVKRRRNSVVYPRFYVLPRWFPRFARFVMDWVNPEPKDPSRS